MKTPTRCLAVYRWRCAAIRHGYFQRQLLGMRSGNVVRNDVFH
jgi:hypothetical protein